MQQLRIGLVSLVIVVATLTACNDEPTDKSPARSVLGTGDDYVALGDSYTAAPKTGTLVSDDGCFNTTVNYPHRIADATGMNLTDNSCSGATTAELTTAQRTLSGEHPPQLDAVTEDTDLVTIRLGANDDNVFARIIKCARFFGPEAAGTPCADADAKLGDDSLEPALAELESNLVSALEDIRDRAPDARVVVIGYPRLAPDEGTCDLLPVPAGDYAYVRHIIEGLNTALESAADEVGVTYVDVYAASEGHDICSDEPWTAGAAIRPAGATAWHPYAAEGQAVAELVLDRLQPS